MIYDIKQLLISSLLLSHAVNSEEIRWTNIQNYRGAAELAACYSAINSLTFGYSSQSGTSSRKARDTGTGSSSSLSASASASASAAPTRRRGNDYTTICAYPPASGSFMLCVFELSGNSTKTLKAVSKSIAKQCQASTIAKREWSYFEEQFENATQTFSPLSELNAKKGIHTNTYPNMTQARASYKSNKNNYFQRDAGTWFSIAFYGYFLFLFVCASIYNFFRLSGISTKINTLSFAKLCQKYVIFPTLIPNGKYSQFYGWDFLSILPPNRIQFLVDLFFFVLEVAFYCVPYRSTGSAWNRWVGYRSGIMAFGKIPLLIMFAGRNNLILWMTGWSYCTFLHYHKIIASYMFVDSLIHSVSYTIGTLGRYTRNLKRVYFAAGVAATVLCGIILIQSFHVFRTLGYEYFLIIHIFLVIGFIGTCWWHCNGLGWMEWMVASCAIWFFDRLIRVIRMIGFGYQKGTVTAVADDLFKVEVPKPKWWIHTSGTYGYIYFAGILFWENHPFTVVCEDDKICAYIRVKKGVTARVWKKLMKQKTKSLSWRICIEGPYGGQLSMMHKRYDDAIFVAGGSGVPGILEGAVHATQGKFIWVSQTMELVTAYHSLLSKVTIPIDIYITREQNENRKCSKKELLADAAGSSSETESQTDSTDISDKEVGDKEVESINEQISIHYGRPNIQDLIESEMQQSPSNNICVSACGPPILMDELRNLIANNVTKWDKSVDFFDEFQVW